MGKLRTADAMNNHFLTGSDREPSRLAAHRKTIACAESQTDLEPSGLLRAGTARGPGSFAMATLLGLFAFAGSLVAQPSSPHVGYVYPAGGRQGAVFQVAVGGQFLNNATNAYISGPGVQAVVVDYSRPLTQKEFNDLRDKLKELQDRRAAAT